MHSRDLAATQQTSHMGSDGSTMAERIHRSGWRPSAMAENIYRGALYAYVTSTVNQERIVHEDYAWEPPERLARQAVDGWMTSPGHRANLLRTSLELAGVGVAFDDEHRWVVTLDLAAE